MTNIVLVGSFTVVFNCQFTKGGMTHSISFGKVCHGWQWGYCDIVADENI